LANSGETTAESLATPIGMAGWLTLAAGALAAATLYLLPWPRWILSYLSILVHEFGHSLTAWAFGYFSIPTFDFTYGGGLARHSLDHRHLALVAAVYAFWCFLAYHNRHNLKALAVLASGTALYTLAAFWADKTLIILMGHGMELVIAGVFLYRASSGSAVANAAERLAYSLCGFFMLLNSFCFAWRIMHDNVERIMYERALNVAADANDFVAAADKLGTSLNVMLVAFMCCCVAVPAAALLFHRHRRRLLNN